MKRIILSSAYIISVFLASAQQMHVKQPNFTSFYEDKIEISPLLFEHSSRKAVVHPEFGVQPFNAQCRECVELIDKRTIDSRFFIDPNDAGHTWSQKSYFPLHYKKNEHDIWRTIDFRLKPNSATPGVYEAKNQPVPTKCDLNRKTTALDLGEMQFEFNRNLSMYLFDEQTVYTAKESANYANYSIGQEGLLVKNIWAGMDMQQIFRTGEIKTNYVINAPLQLPISKGWMVIEDHFTLPEGYVFEESKEGKQMSAEKFQGDYLLKNQEGEVLAMYEKPVYVDAKAWGQHGDYKLIKNGNDYTLQMFVPVEWLTRADNTYPLVIDPLVRSWIKIGNFRSNSIFGADMGFSTKPLSCKYTMNNSPPFYQPLFVRGMTTLTDAYVDLEYQLTYDNTCGNPPIPAPYCTFSQASMEVVNDFCGVSTGKLGCNPASPPYTGTCTTDSNLVAGARSIHINNINPAFLSCIPAQCGDHDLSFTLMNQDSICGDTCGYLCARGSMWMMTIEAQSYMDYTFSRSSSSSCFGDSVTFSVNVTSGPTPSMYIWHYGDFTDTTFTPSVVIVAEKNQTVYCEMIVPNCSDSTERRIRAGSPTLKQPSIFISEDSLICSLNASSYIWYLDSVLIPGANSKWYIPTQIGKYTVQIIDNTGCKSAVSNAREIQCKAYFTVVPSSVDSMKYFGYNRSSGIGLSYLWNFGDGDTSSSPYPTHIYDQPGQYYLCLTVNNSFCTNTYCDSSFYVFKTDGGLMKELTILQWTGVNELAKENSLNIHPNPATNELLIQTNNFHPSLITIYDVNGRKVKEEKYVPRIDISAVNSGIYFIEVRGEASRVMRKFVKL